MTGVAGFLALAVVVLPIAAYLLFSYRYQAGTVQAEAEYGAHAVNHIVAADPEMWRYEHVRILEAIKQRPDAREVERRRVSDLAGVVVAEVGGAVPTPHLARSWPLLDAGVTVGNVQVIRSLRPLFLR